MTEPLAAALADPAAAARRRDRTRAVAARWWGRPEIDRLREALDAIEGKDAGAADAVLDAARPLLDDLGWVREGIAALVAESAADPLFEPPLRQITHETQSGLQLFAHDRLAITLVVLPVDRVAARKRAALGPRSIVFGGRRSLMRVVRSGGATLDLWEAEAADDRFSAATAAPCRPAGRLELTDGLILPIDGARQSWTLAHATGDVTLLHATARIGTAPLTAEYDAETRAFVGASATESRAVRMQLIAGVLRRMGRKDAAPVLAEAAGDGPFYLRWHLARELAALDRKAAVPVLRAMAEDDRHGEVRDAARRTLDLLAA